MDEFELNVPLDFNELLVELNDIGRPAKQHKIDISFRDERFNDASSEWTTKINK